VAHETKAYREQRADPEAAATRRELDTIANTARERNADAIGGTNDLDYMAASHFGRIAWHVRVFGVWVRCSREDLAAAINAAKGGLQK
jgi:hypothetical protein